MVTKLEPSQLQPNPADPRVWPKDRPLDALSNPWPAGTTVVSADSHFLEYFLEPGAWADRMPAKYRDRAPRGWRDETGFHMEADGKTLDNPGFPSDLIEGRPGMWDVDLRIADMDAEGIEKDILFPQRTLGMIRSEDRGYIAACFSAYNELVMEHVKPHKDRLFPVGVINYWDEASVRESGEQMKALGFKAMMMPTLPPGEIYYNSRKLDSMWTAVEDIGLPVSFHVGETFDARGLGGLATTITVAFGGYRRLWSLLTFSGVLERHPGLKLVFTEGGIAWVPSALYEADKVYTAFQSEMNPKLAELPSHYWFKQCYATFMDDPAGLRQLDLMGADRVMWTYDYPHPESTLGYTQSSLQAVFAAADTVQDAQAIAGQTAIDLWRLDD
jgi:predicted TIM-barrel fold metal-dependent hydrolase